MNQVMEKMRNKISSRQKQLIKQNKLRKSIKKNSYNKIMTSPKSKKIKPKTKKKKKMKKKKKLEKT